MEINEKFEQIKERVREKSLHISRVPSKTKTRFMELANEEFEGDYGMLLKKLIEIYDCVYPTGHEEIEERLYQIELKLVQIEQKLNERKEEKPEIKSISGKIIQKRRNENE